MANERKYREDEVKEIFDFAVSRDDVGRPAISDEGGLTLAELQEVGLEVGLEPGRIAEAALALDARREVLPRRAFLGVPISVGRIIDLPRALTDRVFCRRGTWPHRARSSRANGGIWQRNLGLERAQSASLGS